MPALLTRSVAAAAVALTLVGVGALATPQKQPKDARPVVVHVGDSFLGSGFEQALRPKFDALGVKYVTDSRTSAYTTTLNRLVKLDSLLTVHQPKLVILTVGANELSMPVPELHAHAVKGLAKLASTSAPCIWTLTPRWGRPDTGILAIIKRDAGPCRVYDPSAIEKDIPRGPDKIHPSNPKGGKVWADHFWAWMMAGKAESAMPWDGWPTTASSGSTRPAASASAPSSSSSARASTPP